MALELFIKLAVLTTNQLKIVVFINLLLQNSTENLKRKNVIPIIKALGLLCKH